MLSDAERDALEDIRDNIAGATRFVDGFKLDAFLADDGRRPKNGLTSNLIAGGPLANKRHLAYLKRQFAELLHITAESVA